MAEFEAINPLQNKTASKNLRICYQYRCCDVRKRSLLKQLAIIAITFLWTCTSLYAQANIVQLDSISIAYESTGKATNGTILLIAGTGAQLISWPEAFVTGLADRGFRVIHYDNRDIGLSTKMTEAGEPNWPAIIASLMQEKPAPLAYTVYDLAKDAIGLMNALDISKAHIAGVSGGAIIAQIIAAHYPDRTLSLTSVMSTSGNPMLPRMNREIQALIMTPLPPPTDTAAIVARQVKIFKAIGSSDYPTEEKIIRKRVLQSIKRSYYPEGAARQGAAALAAGDRRKELKQIKAPALIIHGAADPMVPVEAGKDVAAHIPGAKLYIIPGMGHDMPLQLIDKFVELISEHAINAIK